MRVFESFAGRLPGVLERFPTGLQQQPLLRIHRQRFARRNVEELRLELIYPFEKCAKPSGNFSGSIGVRIKIIVNRPAVGRDLPDTRAALLEQVPKLFGIARTAGNSAPQTDDRERFMTLLLSRVEFRLQILDCQQRALERRKFSR